MGRLIGRGGMGEVYQARDTVKDRQVALKLLPPHYVHDAEFRERFEQESKTAARLSHPHIIPVHDFGEVDGLLFIDMRLVPGRDLRAVLAQGPLTPARTVHILKQVAAALDAAHRSGLLHRDVKPDNILVDEDDFAYLVDFGLAHGVGNPRMTVVGVALGSLSYMAPERFDTTPTTSAADIYSLSCVLFECLTGTPAFPGENSQALISAQLTKPPPLLGTPIDPVLARGLAKNPAHRYPTAKELVADAEVRLTGIVPAYVPPGAPHTAAPVVQPPMVAASAAPPKSTPPAPAPAPTTFPQPAAPPPVSPVGPMPGHQPPRLSTPAPSGWPTTGPGPGPGPGGQPLPGPRRPRWPLVVAIVGVVVLIVMIAAVLIAFLAGEAEAQPQAQAADHPLTQLTSTQPDAPTPGEWTTT